MTSLYCRDSSIQLDGTFFFNYVLQGSYLLEIEEAVDTQNDKTITSYESLTTPLLIEHDITDLSYSLLPEKK